MNYVGLVLLFLSIVYIGRQVNIYLRMRSRMGKLVYTLTPGKLQKKIVLTIIGVFVVLLIVLIYSTLTQGQSFGFMFSLIMAAVLYTIGKFVSRISELRDNGIIGNLNIIEYKAIRNFTIENRGKQNVLLLRLKDNREFVILVAKSEISDIKKALQGKM